jgi:hypothetical protein
MNASTARHYGFIAAFGAATALAAPDEGNALALCDAFLTASAARTPAYRTEIQPAADRANIGAGRFFSVGPLAGAFTYRPKTYGELTPGERAAVWADPGLPAFLRDIWKNSQSSTRDRPIRVAIRAAEMLRPRPGSIALPRP